MATNMGLLDSGDVGLMGAFLLADKSPNFGNALGNSLLGMYEVGQQRDKVKREQERAEMEQLANAYKFAKEQDQRARTTAMYTGAPYTPNPLLTQIERRYQQRMGIPMAGGSSPQPGLLGTGSAQQPQGLLSASLGQQPEGLLSTLPAAESTQRPQTAEVRPGEFQQLPMGQGAQPPQTMAQRQPSIPELLVNAGIDPRMAAEVAATPEGARAVFNKLAEAYGPRNAEGIVYRLKPQGGIEFMGGVVKQDSLPVVPDGRGGMAPAPIPGGSDYFANRAGMVERAQQEAKAPYNFQSYPIGPGGAPSVASTAELMRREQGPQAMPRGIPPEVIAADRKGAPFYATQSPGGPVQFQQPPSGGGGGLTGPNPIAVKAQEEANSDFLKNGYRPVMDAARSADAVLGRVETLKRNGIMESTGWGTGAKAYAAGMLASLGVKDAERYAADVQTFRKTLMDTNWETLNAAKGIQTEGDAQRAFQTFAQLENTPRANRFILDLTAATQKLAKEKAAFFSAEMQKRKGSGDLVGIEADWQKVAPSIWDFPELRGRWGNDKPSNDRTDERSLVVNQTALFKAREAIKSGKPREAVIQRMREQGFSTEGL